MSNRPISPFETRRRRQRSLVPAPKFNAGLWSAFGERWQQWRRSWRRWRSGSTLGAPPANHFEPSDPGQTPAHLAERPPLQPLTPSPWQLTAQPSQEQVAKNFSPRDQTAAGAHPASDLRSARGLRHRQRSNSRSYPSNRSAVLSAVSLPWLDVAALFAWGVLFLKHWMTGKLYLLIHPNYQGLTICAGFVLLLLAVCQAWAIVRRRAKNAAPPADAPHLALLPKRISYMLLLTTALVGLLVEPRAFASQTAIQRGVTDTLSMTRVRPQSFQPDQRPEDRSLIDWVRLLNVYPEPDAYTGQKVKVQGFVIHPPELPNQYLLISRFVITCCAADVYPVGLPVKLEQPRSAYPPDAWFEVEGTMTTETISNQRQLTIQAARLTEIPEPENPYYY